MIRARIAEDHDDRRRAAAIVMILGDSRPDHLEPHLHTATPARLAVDVDATMRELGATGAEAKVLNISTTGFMARTDEHFEVGTRVWLLLPGRERASAVVKWTAGDKIGAEFSEPIALDDLKS